MAKLDKIPNNVKDKVWNKMLKHVRNTIKNSDEDTIVSDFRRACDTAGWMLFSELSAYVKGDDE